MFFENFIFSFHCDFVNTAALNKMLLALRTTHKVDASQQVSEDQFVYEPKTKTFKRNGDFAFGEGYEKLKAQDKQVFDNAAFVGIYRFPSKIASHDNPKVRLAPNGKAMMLRLAAMDLIQGKAKITNQVQLAN